MKKLLRNGLVLLSVVGGLIDSTAQAATTVETVDFSQLTGALSMTALLAGITAVAAVKIAPNIAKWGYNKLTSMFGGG